MQGRYQKETGDGMGLSIESKMRDIIANPEAVAIIESYVPGASNDSRLSLAMGLSLEKVARLVPNMVKPEWLDEVDAKLRALGD